MNNETLQNTLALVRQSFELDHAPPPTSESELLALLATRIGAMLTHEPDLLMSLLYRLDVLEEKIRPVMLPGAPEPANWGLARLVLVRQAQRLATKQGVKVEPLEGEAEGWAW